jgi:hypothetical protein
VSRGFEGRCLPSVESGRGDGRRRCGRCLGLRAWRRDQHSVTWEAQRSTSESGFSGIREISASPVDNATVDGDPRGGVVLAG